MVDTPGKESRAPSFLGRCGTGKASDIEICGCEGMSSVGRSGGRDSCPVRGRLLDLSLPELLFVLATRSGSGDIVIPAMSPVAKKTLL